METFTYEKPTTLKEAAAEARGDAKLVAGGQSLLAAMKLGLASPAQLVDLGGIAELRGIRADAKSVTIGAMTRHAEVAASKEVLARIPALAHLAALIGDRQVRNMGTLGGSLANNDPAADYPAAALALNATINTNARSIPADAFFKGLYETALNEGEIIVSATFAAPSRAAYEKFKNAASRFALVGVFVAQGADGVRVAVTGAGKAGVFRVNEMEAALARNWSADVVKRIVVPAARLMSDLHASADYRAHLIGVLAGRAVAAA
jgi:carbon-monoxide dehydrogenase medium subunit